MASKEKNLSLDSLNKKEDINLQDLDINLLTTYYEKERNDVIEKKLSEEEIKNNGKERV